MPRPLRDEEITVAAGIKPEHNWADPRAFVTEQGSNYRVIILPGAMAIRFGREEHHAQQLSRMAQLLSHIDSQLPYRVPLPASELARTPLGPAMAFSYVSGEPHPHINNQRHVIQKQGAGQQGAGQQSTGQPVEELANVVHALLRVDVDEFAQHLAPRYAYRGPWDEAKVSRTLGFFYAHAPELVDPAQKILDLALENESGFAPTLGLVHGDLAGNNMLWKLGCSPTLTGILDWDLASAWDPAINLTHLTLWHGPEVIDHVSSQLVERNAISPEELFGERARFFSGMLALENVSDAALRQLAPKPLRRLVTKVGRRLENAATSADALKLN